MALIFTTFVYLASLSMSPEKAFALQIHSQLGGLYVHQIAHTFFLFSMGILIFWLQKSRLIEKRSWRYIQISCLFFILWNIDAIIGHTIDSRLSSHASLGGGWVRNMVLNRGIAFYLYYLIKMDHLLCVPAIMFLFLGLKRLKLESEEKEEKQE